MSNAGAKAALLDGLPRDVGGLAKIVQGLLIHEHIAPAYGVTLSAEQHAQAHMRGVEKMLDCIARQDSRPFAAAAAARRARGRRLPALHAAACRHAAPAGHGARGRAAASAPTSRRASSSTTGSRNTGTRASSAGCWSTPSSTSASASCSASPSIRSTCRATSSWWRATPGSSAAAARPILAPSASSTCTACGSSPATSSATWPRSTITRCCRGMSGVR